MKCSSESTVATADMHYQSALNAGFFKYLFGSEGIRGFSGGLKNRAVRRIPASAVNGNSQNRGEHKKSRFAVSFSQLSKFHIKSRETM